MCVIDFGEDVLFLPYFEADSPPFPRPGEGGRGGMGADREHEVECGWWGLDCDENQFKYYDTA